jgi:hypothetical protein
MSTTEIAPHELLEHLIALAKSDGNVEIMDRTAILHGYLELTRLDPTNEMYRQNLEEAVCSLLQVTSANPLIH